MSKTADQVIHLLDKYPRTRNSDHDLIIGMLQLNGADLSQNQRDLIRGMSFESITRCRRKLQEEGKYTPTDPAVREKRGFKALVVQQNAPTVGAAKLQETIEQN